MKKGILMLFVALFLLSCAFALPREAKASWVGYSTDEIIERSDVILIGEILNPVGEERIQNLWVTHWKVKVHYYLKGDPQAEEFIVTTPGADNKSPGTSIDYSLDQWGKTVLLFLHEREGIYEPLSPQGVVVLQANHYASPESGGAVNGQTVLKEFTIVNPQINNQSMLEHYIADLQTVAAPEKNISAKESANTESSNKKSLNKEFPTAKPFNAAMTTSISLVTLVLLSISIGFTVMNSRKTK